MRGDDGKNCAAQSAAQGTGLSVLPGATTWRWTMLGYCGAWGVGGWLLMLGLWAGFIALVVWAVSRLFPAGDRPGPRELLDRRLAAGDIGADAYRAAREEMVREETPREQMTGPARPKESAR
jgi:putative membrane protein